MNCRLALLAIVLLGCLPLPAMAWSALGHRLVGDLAEGQLSPRAKDEVRRLLADETAPTLGEVASWADALRYSDPSRFRATARWHFINARGGGCAFDLGRDCAGGDCIVAAIDAQRRTLADRTQPLPARRDALKFLVHLVGDLHQPLHAGSREDSGGNGFQISLRRDSGEQTGMPGNARQGPLGTNLHAIWDQQVLASANLDRAQYAARLRQMPPPTAPAARAGTAMDWAVESCGLVESQGIYPVAHSIDRRYLDAQRPLAERRIATAAARLAALLDAALAAP